MAEFRGWDRKHLTISLASCSFIVGVACVADRGDRGQCGEKVEVEIEGRRLDETMSLFEVEALSIAREYSSCMTGGDTRRRGWEKALSVLQVY